MYIKAQQANVNKFNLWTPLLNYDQVCTFAIHQLDVF